MCKSYLFFILLFELLPDTTSTVSGDCDFYVHV